MTASLRADAQRNLSLVLEAAEDVFAERGPDASVDEIAHRAGVGHATVFRRFPTKDALIAAVLERSIARLTSFAEDALASDDPAAAFETFVWRVAEQHARARGLHDCMLRSADKPQTAPLERAATRVVEKAQKAGAIRRDIRPADVSKLISAALKAAPQNEWRRYVSVVLDGLRAS